MRLAVASTALVIAAACAAAPASAQTATIAVTHDDPDGFVLPGETIRVTTTVSWMGAGGAGWSIQGAFAGLRGSTINTPPTLGALGVAGGEIDSDFSSGGLVSLGAPVGGSLVGADIAVTPPYFTGPLFVPPIWNYQGIVVHSFDWTAPTGTGSAGTHRFDFVTPAIAPNFRLYAGWSTPAFIEVPTAFIGASITVVPSPASILALSLALPLVARRRRRLA